MKAKLLFPHFFRLVGWLMAIPGFILGYFVVFNDYSIPGFVLKLREQGSLDRAEYENFTNELALGMVIIGLVLIAFSKVKREDELTGRIRLNALYWAVLINYIVFGLLTLVNLVGLKLTQNGFSGTDNFLVYNLFLPLLIFNCRFFYLLYKSRNEYYTAPVHFLPYKPYHTLGKIASFVLTGPAIYSVISWDNSSLYLYCLLPFAYLLWIYSKERNEDEYINSLRLQAMQIAVYINYGILLLVNAFCYGIDFLAAQLFNLITIPVIFIIVFQYRLYRLRKAGEGAGQLNISLL